MVVPVQRGMCEQLDAVKLPLESSTEVHQEFRTWSKGRDEFHELIASGDAGAIKAGWQKDYFQGKDSNANKYANHQTKMKLRPFREDVSG